MRRQPVSVTEAGCNLSSHPVSAMVHEMTYPILTPDDLPAPSLCHTPRLLKLAYFKPKNKMHYSWFALTLKTENQNKFGFLNPTLLPEQERFYLPAGGLNTTAGV